MKIWKGIVSACLLICLALTASAMAGELLFSKQGQEGYINLETLKQGQELVLFWRSDCAPCLLEIGLLPEISSHFPDLRIILVSLQQKPEEQYLRILPGNISQTTAASDAKQVLQEFGNEKLSLPYSVALSKNGSICGKNYGILGIKKINDWIKTCSIYQK